MPLSPKLAATSYIWQCKQAAALDQEGYKDAELRRHGNAIAAIGRHNRRVSTAGENILPAHQEHWNSSSVFGCIPDLRVTVVRSLEWTASSCPQHPFLVFRRKTKDTDGLCERFRFEEQFVAIRRTANYANSFATVYRYLAHLSSGEVEEQNPVRHLPQVRDINVVAGNGPPVDSGGRLRNYINPCVAAGCLWAHFDNAKIESIPVGESENLVAC